MPYKVMLVDDDSLVRRGLKSFVDWEKKGLVLAGEAADGGKALELLESLRPDIVITDMYMPNYNGLKFIQEAQASFPDLLFIVLSCHNDIHYVKESMRLGAFDYLLKSSIVDSDELDVVLDKAVASLDARSQRNGAELWEAEKAPPERVLLSFLRGKTDNVSAVRGYLQAHQIDPDSRQLFLLAIQMDNYTGCVACFRAGELFDYAVENILQEIVGEYGGGIVFHSEGHVFYTVLHVAAKSSIISPKDRALSICERFRISIKNNLKNTCSIYIDQPRWLEELPASYIEITEEQEANHHLYYDTIVNLEDNSLPSIYQRAADDGVLPVDPIDDVLDYIHQHYREQISLDDLARISNFSKYHLCKKFKEKTKTSIINYILMVRIDKAKELLLQNQDRIFVIAQKVGFNDTSYFNRIFKKVTGYTPKEFIEYNHSVL